MNFLNFRETTVIFFKCCNYDVTSSAYRHFRWEYPEGSNNLGRQRTGESCDKVLQRAATLPLPEQQVPVTKRLAEFEAEDATVAKQSKRVSFGGAVSPELFDKDLPPDTPVRKGAIPSGTEKVGRFTNKLMNEISSGPSNAKLISFT